MSNDVHRFDNVLIFIHYLWIGPLESLVVAYFVYRELGLAGIGGIVAILFFIPLQGYLGKRTSFYRLRTAIRTDERVRLMNEIISAMQVIKLYTWEKPFAHMVALARRSEIRMIRRASYIRSIIPSLNVFVTRFATYLSILTYVLSKNDITAQKVFVVMAYYNILRATMSNSFPKGVANLAETWVSLKRIEKFLVYEEVQIPERSKDVVEKDVIENGNLKKNAEDLGVTLTGATAKWSPEAEENTLTHIDLSVTPGRLVAIIGPVGSGKSSLLQVILSELPLASGTLRVNGRLSYASQEPWLFSGTVRQNILFGEPYDSRRYHRTLRVCALNHDMDQLPHGDRTLVGERGVVLSGGQKARVNLARAVYQEADIYLLDDPLSAVDSHVGKHLFEDCILGLLRDKTVLLVTHQLQYLSHADHLVILDNGAVAMQGTYSDLQNSGLDFAQLLGTEEEGPDVKDGKGLLQQKRSSSSSVESLPPAKEEKAAPKQVAETRTTGQVRRDVYRRYYAATGNGCMLCLVGTLLVLTPIVGLGSDLWLSQWTNMEEVKVAQRRNETHNETSSNSMLVEEYNPWLIELDTNTCIYIYSAFVLGTVIVTMARSLLFFSACMRASIRLHDCMFNSITRATMTFFNTNPSGRILNRFSKDMGNIDEVLPITMIECFQIILILLTIAVMVSVLNYWLLIPTAVVAVVFSLLRLVFLSTSRSIKRLEGVTRSPVFSHISASVQGLPTIRAMGAQMELRKEFDEYQDLNTTSFYLFMAANRAFGLWLDFGCLLFLAFVIFSFLIMTEKSYAGNVGLAITQTLGLTGMFQWGMRQTAELENQMTAVERVLEYTELEHEPALESPPGKKPPSDWPSKGQIVFSGVSLRYAKDAPPVLKDLSFTVRAQEKIGIVGRTGAGKSSLIAALFRLTEPEGTILVDGIDTKSVGLHEVRGKLSIIPQEPVLFSGTMRKNLDPFDEYPDSVLWQALDEVELKDTVNEQPAGLNWHTTEGGSNFSVGQRQLVCLARAIIRRNKILILDEATANVDPQTDALIQKTIRRKFAECTVLTIAHRLHTVMDSDRLLVMDGGRMVEFDHPFILLQNSDSFLRALLDQTGKTMAEELVAVAKQHYDKMTTP
ncbi:probable multidrug resistance-associated protein lethal(2)03659 isoform X2 [Anabrus simplex]